MNYFKQLILEQILIESIQKDLKQRYPEVSEQITKLPPKFIKWLGDRYLENAKFEEERSIEQALEVIAKYIPREQAIIAKWKAPWFQQAVDEAMPERQWQNPADITKMSLEELGLLADLSKQKKPKFDARAELKDKEYLGKFGEWNLWMPFSRESSCKIAGYDKVTKEPKTTWCTARMAGSNLFYNYVARLNQNIILFYVIKDNPIEKNDWLSVGFRDNKPVLGGQYGGVTVNRDNNGLTESDLEYILGDQFEPIMQTMISTSGKYAGKHPSKEIIQKALQSLESTKSLFSGLGIQERRDLANIVHKYPKKDEAVHEFVYKQTYDYASKIARSPNAEPKDLLRLASDPSKTIRQLVIRNTNTPLEVLIKLASDEDYQIRQVVAANTNTPLEALIKLAGDPEGIVRQYVAGNTSAPPEALIKLASDESYGVRQYVATNTNAPPEALIKLANDEDYGIRELVAINTNTPPEALMKLAGDPETTVRQLVAKNTKTPPEALIKLAGDEKFPVRASVARNTNAPPEALIKLANDEDYGIRELVAENTNTPPEVLIKLAGDPRSSVRQCVAENTNAPLEALMKLAGDANSYVRELVAKNTNTPPEVLIKLASDPEPYVRNAATSNPNFPDNITETKRMNPLEKMIREIIEKKNIQNYSNNLVDYFNQKYPLEVVPSIDYKEDKQNSTNPLGKTAYYDPNNKSITIYITGRHIKDCLRSLAHELVHHLQNERGDLQGMGPTNQGYAQEDGHLRKMEQEAYEKGNMLFRDWEDQLKEN